VVSSLVVGIVLDGGGEERVDEGCLSEARLAGNLHQLDGIQGLIVTVLTIMVKAAPRLATILCLYYVRICAACPLEGRTFGWAAARHVSMLYVKLRERERERERERVYVHWQCQLETLTRPCCSRVFNCCVYGVCAVLDEAGSCAMVCVGLTDVCVD
jgi:hypothetical protein